MDFGGQDLARLQPQQTASTHRCELRIADGHKPLLGCFIFIHFKAKKGDTEIDVLFTEYISRSPENLPALSLRPGPRNADKHESAGRFTDRTNKLQPAALS